MVGSRRKKKCPPEGAAEWMLTYGDMVTLLLCFFVMLFSAAEIDGSELKLILAAFSGLGIYEGGNTLTTGRLAELGNVIETLPSMEKGRALDKARKLAVSMFQPEIKTRMVDIKEDERGLVISLSADSFFRPASAEVNIEETRELLQRLTMLLNSEELSGRKFRIEGHTDSAPTDPDGPFPSNWELSNARTTNVLRYLIRYGADEQQFQVAGFAHTVPKASNESPEGRAINRRVDVVILSEGHE
ncbi:MAG: flagellar motor protein MotB [Spirochaetales bacterium]|nr:flagellar motor protein MotB [Spirochaetales bacterium]